MPIVARFRPRNKTRPNKTRPKAKWALGRIFLSFGRVLKTRPQAHFFVVNLVGFPSGCSDIRGETQEDDTGIDFAHYSLSDGSGGLVAHGVD